MKNRTRNSAICILVFFLTGGLLSLNADVSSVHGYADIFIAQDSVPLDTTPPRFPIAPVIPVVEGDLNYKSPIDFRKPTNLNNDFEYNPLTNRYELRSKIGDTDVTTPIALTTEEYLEYTMQKSMNSYFYSRNREDFNTETGSGNANDDALSMFDFNFDLGPAEKLFGPGGVKLQANGSALLKMGFTNNRNNNPTYSERQRNKTSFDFDTQINTNINASVGDKINFDLNYNTESTFDFDNKKLKLGYVGKEDEIIKVLEAGNVSMNTTNSLIRGGTALFGIKTELQFGKLTVGAIFSQQESQSRSTRSKGNVQTTPFEVTADSYDENMHYFLSHYFKDTYNESMKTLPYISSGIKIEKIEVWVTNKRSNYDEARNIVAFADLGEHKEDNIGDKNFIFAKGSDERPFNNTNNLYGIISGMDIRTMSTVSSALEGRGFTSGVSFEKIENARKLTSAEYRLNDQLGYISLRTRLQPDEVLAVAFQYTYRGEQYQVGEFSTDNPTGNTNDNLFLKLVKGTNISPDAYTWHLMMRNVYTVANNRTIEKDKFRLDVKYQNDTTGIYMTFINEGAIAKQPLIRVLNLDRLDSSNETRSDGFFDYVEGLTVFSDQGKIIFPVVQPFGKYLWDKIGNEDIAKKYVYHELYDSTLTVAKQTAEKNKFIITGEYKGAGSSSIELDGFNIAKGSVAVYANGTLLKENQDYTINYTTGDVTIINPAYVNADITTRSESQSGFGMQRKTMMGVNLNYAFSKNFNIGGTLMNLSEMPVTLKTGIGEESINNTIFGFNTNYTTQSYWLTNILDKLPLLELTAPSQITLSAEYAKLIPGHYKSEYGGDHSYIDDFEKAKTSFDLRSPYSWNLSATPAKFDEYKSYNIDYGKNRALLAWYYIDPMFTRKSSLTPTHLKNDLDQLSNHYVREIYEYELYPNRDARYNDSGTISVLNLAFYPKERGPYNLDVDGVDPTDGTLKNPESRWGGIFRKLESSQTDFEAQNIEHIEFWLLDPFIYNKNSKGGKLYINLGDVSEDILKDGKKFFENGLPIDGDLSKVEETTWGYVPKMQSLDYAFDNTSGARKRQDVGLNGLSTEQEKEFGTYSNYIEELRSHLDPTTVSRMERDPFSPFNDPAGDNYHYFRGSDYDRDEVSILARYKRYNGTEGNSPDSKDTSESYQTAAKLGPDVEDINQDNTLNENENYFEYEISLTPNEMEVGRGFIVDKREVSPTLKNGDNETVTWYQFKIPIRNHTSAQGNIRDFSSIRFVRMFLTNFADSTILRFGTLELVKGDWRVYSQDLSNPNMPPQSQGSLTVSAVNIEENGDKEPVNYVMPPRVNRMVDPGQTQLRMQNEQSLSLKVDGLAARDARAVYKNTNFDTRQYRRLQMFVHAEKLKDDYTDMKHDDLSIFLRLGSDYKNNYYEYEIPLKLTQHGKYNQNSTSEREAVWPTDNMFDFPFELLTNLKLKRNKLKRQDGSEVSYHEAYSEQDPNKLMNTVTVKGNPTLSEIKVIMIGIRNNTTDIKNAEIWVDELRLTEYNEDGGWAANVNLYLGLSDLGSVSFSGKKETAGFGSLDQGIMDRNIDDHQTINIATQIELGKFFPEKAKVSLPVYYSYNEDRYDPKYNPLDQDILLKDALNAAANDYERDSIRSFAEDKVTNKSLEINNVRVNVTSKNPMPYDPANFSLGYSHNERNLQNATTEYERQTATRVLFGYSYSPMMKPWQPFNRTSSNNQAGNRNNQQQRTNNRQGGQSGTNFFKEIGIGLLPKNIAINSDINRDYYEIQLRDVTGGDAIPVSFREDFYWDRNFSMQWDLTKNLSLDLRTGTQARIDTPHDQVNKKFNLDAYELWKDSVGKSIRDWGTPLNYGQTFSAKYNIPFKNVPILNFITANLSYSAEYDWDKGANVSTSDDDDESLNMGNTIRNSRTWGIENVNINLMNLYSKSKFLDEANKKFSMSTTPTNTRQNNRGRTQDRNQANNAEKQKKKYEGEIKLNPDTVTVVTHSLDNKRIRVTARGENGKLYDLKFKKKDKNSIEIKNLDSVQLSITVTQLPPLSEEWWYKPAQVAARGLMMVRRVGFSYNETSGMTIPGFDPEIGDFFGQGSTGMGRAPGLDFAFGLTDESYLQKALDNDWLVINDMTSNPAIFNQQETFTFTSTLEPIVGMKIDLNASRTFSSRNEYYYMYNNSGTRKNGSFSMTMIGLKDIFNQGNAKNGYASKAFDQFLSNRDVIAGRLANKYSGTTYPIEFAGWGGQSFDAARTPINTNSTDVLIPAFLAAYTGTNPNSANLDLFPSLMKLMPNWDITYEGLIQLPFIKKHFKSFTLGHTYKCRYSIGSYSTFPSWIGIDDNIGFVSSISSGDDITPIPSSPYDISSVSIQESFDPLFKINSTFLNNTNLNIAYKTGRTVNLNISSYQVVEQNESAWTVGSGYRIENFNKVLRMRKTGGENFNNELRVDGSLTFTSKRNLIRKIEDGSTQATQGDSQMTIKLTADYNLSKMVTFQAYFDRQMSNPLVSSTAYPYTKTSFGISLRVNFSR